MKRKIVGPLSLLALAFPALAACQPAREASFDLKRDTDYKDIEFRSCGPTGPCYGAYAVDRKNQTAEAVVDQAMLLAEVCTGLSLPDHSIIPQADLDAWAANANLHPDGWGTVPGEIRGERLIAQYQPQSDFLKVSRRGLASGPPAGPPPTGSRDQGIGLATADANAMQIVAALEAAGAIDPSKYTTITRRAEKSGGGSGVGSWASEYKVWLNPTLDGLPLKSSELMIGVNAITGECEEIYLQDQTYTRLGDVSLSLSTETAAEAQFKAEVSSTHSFTHRVATEGGFGYYLPYNLGGANLEPMYVAEWAIATDNPAGGTVVSDKKLGGLSLVNPASGLVNLLQGLM